MPFEFVAEPWLQALVGDIDVPARIIRPSRYSVTGYVSTQKASLPQDSESSLEHDFYTILNFDRRVERFVAQPFTIHWRDAKGTKRRYTPDVIVKYGYLATLDEPYLRTTVFEVKPREILKRDWQELRPKFRAAMGWARQRGCCFHVVTEEDIRTPFLKNALFLSGYERKHLGDGPHVAWCQKLLREKLYELGRTTPKELLEAITPYKEQQAELIPWMWNLVSFNAIGADLRKPLTMSCEIWTADSEDTIGAYKG